MEDAYDVVIVGSGFGGAIMACRLAQAGRSVCVLERGRRWRPTDFPRSPHELARTGFWDMSAGRFGVVEYRAFRGMHVIQGSGVGGGSLHYFNVHLRAPESIFDSPRWPASIDRKRLDPYYDLAEDMLDATALVPPAGRVLPLRTTSFQEACRSVGREPELVKIAVYTGPGRRNPHGAAIQLPCDYSGDCGLGCAAAAKNTLDLNYLPLAERHGAEIYPLHQVSCIAPLRRGGFRVDFQRLFPEDPASKEPGEVQAETVVVSAGALGTNEPLLSDRTHPRTWVLRQWRHASRRRVDRPRHRSEPRPQHHRGGGLCHLPAADLRGGPRLPGPAALVHRGDARQCVPDAESGPLGESSSCRDVSASRAQPTASATSATGCSAEGVRAVCCPTSGCARTPPTAVSC